MSTLVTDSITIETSDNREVWVQPLFGWLFLLCLTAVAGFIFRDGIEYMVNTWKGKEEFSHGYFIPFIAMFLIWQKSDVLRTIEFKGSWLGTATILVGIVLYVLGELSSLYTIIQYGFLVTVAGIILCLVGREAFKVIWVPIFFLVFMIPLPNFLLFNLSLKLQLISSALGVQFIRLCDISVYLEGNVIDLGSYKLQVVEACSGLRYLFPFMSLSFLFAYLFKGAFWKKTVIFLSSIPITIFMNSFRIGIIGVLVENFGQGAAEGFLHDFEGWAIFMVCMALLLLEMRFLAGLGPEKKRFGEVFSIEYPAPVPSTAGFRERKVPTPAWVGGAGLLLAATILPGLLATPIQQAPSRQEFTTYPLDIASWRGQREIMERKYQEALKLDDYFLANYRDRITGDVVNYYVAYYASQSKGRSIHSPRSCLPGGGWVVTNLPKKELPLGATGHAKVSRVSIQQGDVKQLVYFWTQQRGRIINNEFLIKWYLFWDALTQHRTDGGLIRIITVLKPTETMEEADKRLSNFAEQVAPINQDYIPD